MSENNEKVRNFTFLNEENQTQKNADESDFIRGPVIFIGFEAFLSHKKYLDSDADIVVVEANKLEELKNYIKIKDEFKKIKIINDLPWKEQDDFFNNITPDYADKVRIIRDAGNYLKNREKYSNFLQNLVRTLTEKKKVKNENENFIDINSADFLEDAELLLQFILKGE